MVVADLPFPATQCRATTLDIFSLKLFQIYTSKKLINRFTGAEKDVERRIYELLPSVVLNLVVEYLFLVSPIAHIINKKIISMPFLKELY
jgi:hypothetical protein